MALSFLNVNENKTELLVFGTSGAREPPPIDLGPMRGYVKPAVTNLDGQ